MADIFISYSKKDAQLTKDLARDLEAAGYTTWWDTSLLPGDKFPKEIERQIDSAWAAIVIWTENAVTSEWVQSEATQANSQDKLITVRNATVDVSKIPHPFKNRHTSLVTDRAKIFEALGRKQIAPSRARSYSTQANLDDAPKALVSVHKVLESSESFVIQGRRP
jgi:hypothetical protein